MSDVLAFVRACLEDLMAAGLIRAQARRVLNMVAAFVADALARDIAGNELATAAEDQDETPAKGRRRKGVAHAH